MIEDWPGKKKKLICQKNEKVRRDFTENNLQKGRGAKQFYLLMKANIN
jgi:hypothetical protein